jgi:hypothetical protein
VTWGLKPKIAFFHFGPFRIDFGFLPHDECSLDKKFLELGQN